MADPKYANLPGIAHDQPDVFETSDLLPEADQHIDQFQDIAGDSIETLHLSGNEAFGAFKGKHIHSGKVDFSDKIRPPNRGKGYVSWSGDLELGGDEPETLVQKYQRLNCEVRELADEVERLRGGGGDDDDDAAADGAAALSGVAVQAEALQRQLADIRLEEMLGSEALRSLEDPSGRSKERLLKQLEQLKQIPIAGSGATTTTAGDGGTTSSSSGGGGDGVTYELFLKPELSRLQAGVAVAQLEKRLDNLEKVLGATPEKMNILSVETSGRSVCSAIAVLSARTTLLDPQHLDHVEGRLFALQQKMNAVADQRQTIDDAEKINKISELYDLVHRSEAMSAALPEVVDRLETLQGLHDQALQFSKALSQLDGVQQQLGANLRANAGLVNDAQKKFAHNIQSIQANLGKVESRLEKLCVN